MGTLLALAMMVASPFLVFKLIDRFNEVGYSEWSIKEEGGKFTPLYRGRILWKCDYTYTAEYCWNFEELVLGPFEEIKNCSSYEEALTHINAAKLYFKEGDKPFVRYHSI